MMAKILIVSGNLSTWEKNQGGVERTATLAEAFPEHDVTFLCFAWSKLSEESIVGNNIKFIKIPVSDKALMAYKSSIRATTKNNYDVAVDALKPLLTDFSNKLKSLAPNFDLAIFDHFSVAPFIDDIAGVIPIIYNSHNAEISMGKQLYPKDKLVLQAVQKMERTIIEKSVAMTYCSTKDFQELKEIYKVPSKTKYVPNGTTMHNQTIPEDRIASKDILFVGSGHPPNGVAAKRVLEIAKLKPDYNFIICGKASGWVSGMRIPKNVQVLGLVDEDVLDKLFKESFAFINPMDSGSGTHLKMMKALSYGIPIISSPMGARGFADDEIAKTMFIIDSDSEAVGAIEDLTNLGVYRTLSNSGYALSKRYDWETIKVEYAAFVQSVLDDKDLSTQKANEINNNRTKVLVYSIVRNIEKNFDNFYSQLKDIVQTCPDHEFYLSIYENDSIDNTKKLLFNSDWSLFSGVSIITENINTEFFGPVKDAQRVENLSNARNKAIEAGGFLNKVDYVLMVEGDTTYKASSVQKLLSFRNKEPNFDIVSSVSIREDGTHYDRWATRTGPEYVSSRSELEKDFKRLSHGRYYSTSNGLCLYRAKGFQDGARHHWINTVTNEADCEMVVVCQKFQELGYNNIYINYNAFAYHHK
jgi:glycosyltransferase involved in cell wall biosynthesis